MILNLILASIQSILQVIVIVVFGFILTKAGYFTNEKQKWLSKLNMVFFTPCLLFSNIASVISFEKLLAYWPIPVFFMLFVSLSYITAQLVSRIVRLNESYRRFVLACTMFSNTNSLPIAVITSLAVSEGGKVLYWGADDTQSDVAARGISYILFFAIFGNILRWSYGYSLLQNYGEGHGSDQGTLVVEYGATNQTDEDISTHRSSSPSSSSLSNRSLLDVEEGQISRRDSTTTIAGEHRKPVNEATSLLSSFPILPSDVDGDGLKERPAWVQKIMDNASTINSYMTPPLYAALLALFVGLIPPLKGLLYDKQGFLYPSLTSAVQLCGKAAVPIILVCLGAQLTDISQMHNSLALTKPVTTAVTVRTLLLPLIVIPIVLLFVNFGSKWSAIAADPVFSVMMIIVGCTPTAINLVQICQVTGAFEEDMLRVLFWSYGVICVPMFTLVVFVALNIVDRFL